MSLPPEAGGAHEESAVRRCMAAASKRIRRLERVDRFAVAVITLGGVGVILSVIAILVFIGAEALPLFRAATATLTGSVRLSGRPATAAPPTAAIGTDEFGRYVYSVDANGTLAFFDPASGARVLERQPAALGEAAVTSVSRSLTGDFVGIGTSDGRVALLKVLFRPVYAGSRLHDASAELREGEVVVLAADKRAVQRVSYAQEGDRKVVAGQISDAEVGLWWSEFAGASRDAVVRPRNGARVLAVAASHIGTAVAATDRGEVYHWELGDDGATLTDVVAVGTAPVTALRYVIGGRTFIAGSADGRVSAWFRAPVGADGAPTLVRAAEFEPHAAGVTAIAASTRDRTFATASANGRVVLRHQTSRRTLVDVPGEPGAAHVVLTPRGDGLIAVRDNGVVDRFAIVNPHPEVSWHTLFGKVWYEGYAEPEYVWQSTAATDDFEPKLSLVPLVFGTIKGTFYALLFAMPLAVLGALYTSQFVHPSIRAKVKPTIEIMAALPSVVIGFVAGLYMAPVVERHLVGVGLMMVLLPIFGTGGLLIWNAFPRGLRRRVRMGTELAVIVPMLVAGGWLAVALAPAVESAFFGGDVRQWLTALGLTYDQRNSLVVGIAMGFAVIPIIFTISEDAFSSVPSSLTAASLALGASRWQTAVRVVIPTASPAVFSAIMIGLGRAVGETMIVLMATGNTPVLDWSIFNGFRTLSANIAVETPEAPQGGTLYRTLFLSAAVLFVMTFMLNTVAEVVRQRLREKYKAV